MYKCLKPLNWIKHDNELPSVADNLAINGKMAKYFGKVNLYTFCSENDCFKLICTSWYFKPKWFLKKYQLTI